MSAAARLGKHLLQDLILPGSFVWRVRDGSESALTFDDGPSPEFTAPLLDLLSRHQVKATFFVVGNAVAARPDLVKRMVAEGHSVGSHTQTHRELPTLNRQEFQWELDTCRHLIAAVSGLDTRLMRPPRGRVDAVSLYRASSMRYKTIHWSRTYSDFLRDGTAALLGRIRANPLQPRDIALFHDNNPYTLEAMDEMLPQWIAAGREFARIV